MRMKRNLLNKNYDKYLSCNTEKMENKGVEMFINAIKGLRSENNERDDET